MNITVYWHFSEDDVDALPGDMSIPEAYGAANAIIPNKEDIVVFPGCTHLKFVVTYREICYGALGSDSADVRVHLSLLRRNDA